MTQLTLNLLKDTEASGERMISSLLEASLNHANRIQQQENALEKKMRDTSGRRCLESYGKFSRHGSWAKMFSALLIGMEGWYSKRCRLTWKLKGTKSNRMYFQLVPSTHRTEGTESGLLPTPTMMEDRRIPNGNDQRQKKIDSNMNRFTYIGLLPTVAAQDATGIKNLRKDATVSDVGFHSMSLTHFATIGLLPTPTASIADRGTERQLQVIDGQIQNISPKGTKFGINIRQLAEQGFLPTPKTQDQRGNVFVNRNKANLTDAIAKMLPTPTTRDYKGGKTQATMQKRKERGNNAVTLPDCFAQTSGTSQLSPLFTLEMMGFPTDWTLLPFLSANGETNPSKPQEMP